jgi:aryl-alcohol dehydrogenase-like predicted oxidoreductase
MRTRALGTTGIEASEIGFGAMQLGNHEWNGPEQDEAIRLVHEAIRVGCTFIDTSPVYAYGRSEQILGQALAGRRDEVVICTKFGVWPDATLDYSADRIEESVAGSLERMRTDHLDVLLFHGLPPDRSAAGLSAHYKALQGLVDSGMVRTYGMSFEPPSADELRRYVEEGGVSCFEFRFNPLAQRTAALFPELRRLGVGLIGNVPLESGWLSGKYDASSTFDVARARWTDEDIAHRAKLVAELRAIVPEGVGLAEASLAFILAQPEVSTIIPGTKSLEQLHANAEAANVRLPDDVVEAIRALGASKTDELPW